MKTDIEIAREIELKPIQDIAQDLGIDNANVEPYGHHIAKIGLSSLKKGVLPAGDMPKYYRWKTSTSTSQETSMQSPRRTI